MPQNGGLSFLKIFDINCTIFFEFSQSFDLNFEGTNLRGNRLRNDRFKHYFSDFGHPPIFPIKNAAF